MRFAHLMFATASLTGLCLTQCGDSSRLQPSMPDDAVVSAAPGRIVPVETFLRSIIGEYDILEAGPAGELRPFKDYVGTIEMDGDHMLFTFPYCPPKEGCLPGYAYFPLASAVALDNDTDRERAFSVTLDDGSLGRFRWREHDGQFTFVNEQLEHSDGAKRAIEYRLRRR